MDPRNFKLSVSKTKTFLSCKKQYQFIYVHKLPRKDRDYHILGKFCHKVLEEFHNSYMVNNSTNPFNVEMGNAFKAGLAEFKDKMSAEMKKECWNIIDQYLKIVTNDKKNNLSANVIACEKKFEVNIENKIILNGAIDRIQIDADNVIHVCDYKTTKNKKYIKDDFFQLLTYAYVIMSERPDVTKVRASYILMRHGFEYITKEFSAPEIMAVREKYLDYAEKINLEKDFEPNPTILCRFCDFSHLCAEGKKMLEPSQIYGEVTW